MNEEQKNIETCLPESILAEVASVPTDPQFVSLVEESLDPLKQQAFQQAGSDAYNEVVASHQPYTFTSFVRQMKSNLILLLRRFWRFPFGSGTIRSLSDMWAHYINRLQGSETYGIPSRLDQLTDLPSAPLLVADRKISNGDNTPDGISLAHAILSSTANITELIDDNYGWTMDREIPSHINPRRIVLNCETMSMPNYSTIFIRTATNLEELEIRGLKNFYFVTGNYGNNLGLINNNDKMKRLVAPDLERISTSNGQAGAQCDFLQNCTALEEFIAVKLTFIGCEYFIVGCTNLRKVVVGKLTRHWGNAYGSYANNFQGSNSNLVHFELGAGTDISLNMIWWEATNALDATGTDLVEDPTAHPTWNNLQQFLSNFRSFIVLRLENRKTTSALTLTLSASVYNAVTGANSGWASQHTLAELGITDNDLTDLETELGITSATIYATWLDTYTGANGIHWDINKAN